MAISRSWNLDRLTHDLYENIFDSLPMLAFDSRPIMSSFMRLGGGLLCLGVAHFLKLLGASMELNSKLDVSAISNYVLRFLSDFVCLSVLWAFVAGLPTMAFVIEAFFSEAWNSERKMIHMHSTDGSVSEEDRKSKENSSGIGHNEVSDKMSSWNRGRGLEGGNNNGGYNGGVGRLNNGNRYISSSSACNSNQLRWRQNSTVFNSQGSDVTQQKCNLPMTNPDAFKYRATSMAPSTDENKVPLYTVLPPSRSRNLWSQQGPGIFVPQSAPTWSENYIQAQIDSIVAASMTSSARREKVYCDKWIHEGVCAFTQVGCKYLHTMPMDTETQVKLGLYHSLPRWYCVRTQNWRQIKEPANNGGNDNASTTTYDSGNGSWPSNQDQSWGNFQASFGRAHSFGPIAPPNKASTKL